MGEYRDVQNEKDSRALALALLFSVISGLGFLAIGSPVMGIGFIFFAIILFLVLRR